MKKKIFITVTLLLLLAANIQFMPWQDYIAPSEFFYNNAFSTKLWHYRHRDPVDFLIVGNSRTEASLYPEKLQSALGVPVHNLSVGGAYLPMFHEILTKVIGDNLPKNIVIGVGPGDFDRENPSAYKGKVALYKTYGYQALSIPYFAPLKWLETKMTDMVSVIFPGFYYRSEVERTVFSRPLKKLEREGAWYSFIFNKVNYYLINHYYEAFWESIPQFKREHFNAQEFIAKTREYARRFRFLFSWHPQDDSITPDGGSKERTYHKEGFDYAQYLQDIKASGDLEKYRSSDFCDSRTAVISSESSEQIKLLRFLEQKKVNVYLVVIPSIQLSACENNDRFNRNMQAFFKQLEKRFSNVVVLDYLNNFNHPYQDFSFYRDMDHMNPRGAELLTARLAQDIRSRQVKVNLSLKDAAK